VFQRVWNAFTAGVRRLRLLYEFQEGVTMAHFLSIDMDLLERGMKKLPPLPAALVFLAWGASMIGKREPLAFFSRTGLFSPGRKKAPTSELDMAS
jgi:hypothetical protein